MKRLLALVVALVLLGVVAGCGTNTPPSGGGGPVGTQGQEPTEQPESGGLKNGAYTAAHNVCSLYPVQQLAQQNGLPSNATAKQVAKKIGEGEATKQDQQSAYRGCLDAINTK